MTTFLGMRESEKTALFIDGANLYKAARALGFDMDYKSLLAKSRTASKLLRAYYFTSIQEDKEQDYSPLRPLVDWLDYNGYTMVTKMAREFTDAAGKKRFKGSTDIELAVELMSIAPKIDHAIVFTGNGDFKRAIESVQAMGVRVTIVSTIKSQPPMASDELRRQADRFFDLAELEKDIGRTGGPQRKPRATSSNDYDDEFENEFDDEFEDVD